MNPHRNFPVSILSAAFGIKQHWQLIVQMVRREVQGRYRGSMLGLLWSFINPLMMLLVYTFVFSEVFKARWGGSGETQSKTEFALILFTGMIVHGLLSEILSRSPTLITANTNYVKKVVFPLEVLPVIAVGASLFHNFMALLMLLVVYFFEHGFLHWTVVFLPLIWLPLLLAGLGFSWFLASVGTFVRDIAQSMALITTLLMFMSPVFYPISALPEQFRAYLLLNPLTFIIEQSREVIIWGHLPNWVGLVVYTLVSMVVAWLGYVWFQKTRKGFADVL